MVWARSVVLMKGVVAWKVKTAAVADPVGAGIRIVLLKCMIVWKRSVAPFTVCHGGGCQRKREKRGVFGPKFGPGLLSTNSHMTRLPCEAAWCEALGSGWIYSVLQHFIWIIYLKRDPYEPIETIDTSRSSCITFIDKVSKARICVIGKRRQA